MGKELIVASVSPERYVKFDNRSLKPFYLTDIDTNSGAVVEELDYIKTDNIRKKVEYIPPNSIGIQLSIVENCISDMKKIKVTENLKFNSESMIMKERVYKNSKLIYDHISLVQQAIVFGYTALETFANLSIPDHYEYSLENNKKIKETYNKEAIERWIPLKEKISEILPSIYETTDIKKKNLWNEYLSFETLRHEIIHQKSIDQSTFYRKYFKNNIYNSLGVPRKIIEFYNLESKKVGKTNRLWPWIEEDSDSIPMSGGAKEFFSNTKIVGNLYGGKK